MFSAVLCSVPHLVPHSDPKTADDHQSRAISGTVEPAVAMQGCGDYGSEALLSRYMRTLAAYGKCTGD